MDQIDMATGEVREVEPRMPPAVAAAIIAVKKQVKQLGHDDKNEHGKYGFVSVDKFYAIIGKLMADAGLALLIDETATEVKGSEKSGNPWLFVQYNLAFLHESGAMSAPLRRSCALPINGPQTYGAAQSYIEKQFLRQVFKVPTGERDADETAQGDDAPSGRAGAQRGATPARQQPARQQAAPAPSGDQAEAQKRFREIRAEVDASMSAADLIAIANCAAWVTMEKMVRDAETKEMADELIGRLHDRIERRKLMLAEEATY